MVTVSSQVSNHPADVDEELPFSPRAPVTGVWRLDHEASEPPTQLLLALGLSSTARDAAEKVDITLVMRMVEGKAEDQPAWVLEHHSILGRKRRRFVPAYGFVVREDGAAAGRAEHRLAYREPIAIQSATEPA